MQTKGVRDDPQRQMDYPQRQRNSPQREGWLQMLHTDKRELGNPSVDLGLGGTK